MRFLFVKTDQGWPRACGHDVHGYHMMRALTDIGHDVALTTLMTPKPEALEGLDLCDLSVMPSRRLNTSFDHAPKMNWSQQRFQSYWGIEQANISFVGAKADALGADAVVVVGMEVLPYLAGVKRQQRIWYAADEWVWHHLSLIKALQPGSWRHVKQAVVMGLYEFAFSNLIDRAWVVSGTDARALKMVTRIGGIDVVPNGVDSCHYAGSDVGCEGHSCTFWGCLSFAPNVQALQWFCERVWPRVKRRVPEARFSIFGFDPPEDVLKLALIEGVTVTANVPDIRKCVDSQQVVVLPFLSGGGVKNKLLEAASMAKPILCSPRACNGLNGDVQLPFAIERLNARRWQDELIRLWNDANLRRECGEAARRWVMNHHSWEISAETAVAAMSGESDLRLPARVSSLCHPLEQ